MAKRLPKKEKKNLKSSKKKIAKRPEKEHNFQGGTTRCRFCKTWVSLDQAWYHPNCGGYQERFRTSGDVLTNSMIVEPIEEVEIIEDDSNGES